MGVTGVDWGLTQKTEELFQKCHPNTMRPTNWAR